MLDIREASREVIFELSFEGRDGVRQADWVRTCLQACGGEAGESGSQLSKTARDFVLGCIDY